jgi:DNA-binding response OmpR family regulator
MIVMEAKILLIEGKRAERPSFLGGLTKKGFQVESAPNGAAAVARLAVSKPHLVVVDAASMRTSGKRICQAVRKNAPGVPVVLILEKGAEEPDRVEVEVALIEPFTLQKLVNRIRPLLPSEPKSLISAGAIQLDTDLRLVRCENHQARLTPRLVTLLKILMDHPGELVDRKDLFRQVWDTTYTVDTRTLDVHVSWLRQAIEEDPRHPKYIKTIRGMGYRLDIETPSRAMDEGSEPEE